MLCKKFSPFISALHLRVLAIAVAHANSARSMFSGEGGIFLRKKPGKIVPPPHASPSLNSAKSLSDSASLLSDKPAYVTSKAHHAGRGYYVNPWPSATPKKWLPQSFSIPVTWNQEVHPSVKRKSAHVPPYLEDKS